MNKKRIALITCQEYPELTADDRLLIQPLQAHGFEVQPESWDSASTNWREYDCCVLRSSWDYHLRIKQFLDWLRCIEQQQVNVWNPVPIVRWNLHKSYLKDLALKGIPTVATCWLERGSTANLKAIVTSQGWDEAIVKPAVSASAYRTFRIRKEDAALMQQEFADLILGVDVLIQPFITQIQTEGEWSFIFFGGEFSDAVLRKPAENDFRTQPEFGSTVTREETPDCLVAEARSVIRAANGPLLYARVDTVPVRGHLLVLELELIEPCLYLEADPQSPLRFVKALVALTQDHLWIG